MRPNYPSPDAIINCPCCNAILGYKVKEGNLSYLYVYAYPVVRIHADLENRRISTRILNGAVLCPRCENWIEWNFWTKS